MCSEWESVSTYDGMVIHAVFSTCELASSNPIDDKQFEEWMDDPDHNNELMHLGKHCPWFVHWY